MPRKKKGGLIRDLTVGEDFRIAVNLAIKKFRNTEEEKELEFPSSLDSDERAYVHRLSGEMGLQSKSRNKGAARFLTVYKTEGSTIMQSDAKLALSPSSRQMVQALLNQYPVTAKERQDLLPPTDRERNPYLFSEARDLTRTMGKLNSGIPQIPSLPIGVDPQIQLERKSLPIFAHRAEIIQSINQHQVTLITGDTGSGKTTQVPQYIMESATDLQLPCRIVCTEPRRLAAVAVAERVASERNELVGQVVGYQIRLESRISLKTLLTFCTNGVLLRSLMGVEAGTLGTLTHVIVDEVHERDRFSDFLLTVLRDALTKFRSLKLIIMSATVDVQLFMNYFNNIHHISVPGRMYPVEDIYLEQVLLRTKYMTPEMKKVQKFLKKSGHPIVDPALVEDKGNFFDELENLHIAEKEIGDGSGIFEDCDVVLDGIVRQEEVTLTQETIDLLDSLISEAFRNGDFDKLVSQLNADSSLVDYKHSQTHVTALMAAAGQGSVAVVEQLLALGADVSLKASNGWNARDFAVHTGMNSTVAILESYQQSLEPVVHCNSVQSHLSNQKADSGIEPLTDEELEILALYHKTFNDDNVDYNLIVSIIAFIQAEYKNKDDGAILVFLPGYEDIVKVRELLDNDSSLLILMLHSQMQTIDHHLVFRPSPRGRRKLILATNIAETSITISDVVFVIDSGKLKEKSYDAISGVSMLKVTWVSQTSATQRKGRAGRCRSGQVYRLFSRRRFASFQKYQTPEILRTPLTELCLQTKLLAQPPMTPIADFLARAPEPPSFMVTRNAVQVLKTIEALDAWEDVTELGNHLLDLPIEPRLGKMLLYSVVLKCLDPVLTIICCSAYKDPFLLPAHPTLRRAAMSSRRDFAAGSKSDHMALLRAFQAWQKATSEGRDRLFCHTHQISSATMEMITGMRGQLLGQLRASGFVRAKGSGDIRDLNRNSENWAVVKAALTAGAYPNLARFDRNGKQLRSQKESKVRLHQSSVLVEMTGAKNSSAQNQASIRQLPTDWLIFDEMSRAGRLAMIRGVTAVSPITVALFAGQNRLPIEVVAEADAGYQGNIYLEESSDSEAEERGEGVFTMLRLDDWAIFRSEYDIIHQTLQLRQKWSSLFLRKLHAPHKAMSQSDEMVIQTIVNLLSTEEQYCGLTQPSGIGQRPKLLPVDNLGSAANYSRPNDSPEFCQSNSELSSILPTSSSSGISDPSMTTSPSPSSANRYSPVSTLFPNPGSNKFFIIKATSAKAVEVSLTHGLWQFGNQTEKRLLKVIKSGFAVILIFSVQGSGHFQGYAQFLGHPSNEKLPDLQSQGQGSGSGIQYWIEWLKRANIPFQSTRHLLNPYNENKKVQTSRDGQEIPPNVGESLCRLWEKVPPFVAKPMTASGGFPFPAPGSGWGNGSNVGTSGIVRSHVVTGSGDVRQQPGFNPHKPNPR